VKKIRWSPDAADDFVRIIEYIRKDNDAAAQRIARVALQRIASLKQFPRLGRAGRVNETRELPLSPLPFVVVYRLKEEWIEIVRVLHGAQRWP
jgi:toxin ParE1/3/4